MILASAWAEFVLETLFSAYSARAVRGLQCRMFPPDVPNCLIANRFFADFNQLVKLIGKPANLGKLLLAKAVEFSEFPQSCHQPCANIRHDASMSSHKN
jgi:hypothetical protein